MRFQWITRKSKELLFQIHAIPLAKIQYKLLTCMYLCS